VHTEHSRRRVSSDGKRERRQGCQRLDRSLIRRAGGRNAPASWEENAHARDPCRQRKGREATRSVSIRRSGSRVVKHADPRSSRAEPRLREAPTSRKRRQEPGTHEVRVHAITHGWQKSIGRIARLAHRRVARPRGGRSKQGASRKEARSTVSSDAGHERGFESFGIRAPRERWRIGARMHVSDQKFACVRPVGFGSQAQETTEGVLGLPPILPLPAG
jgi:hypothetical protein